jgi:hypothetical protein
MSGVSGLLLWNDFNPADSDRPMGTWRAFGVLRRPSIRIGKGHDALVLEQASK